MKLLTALISTAALCAMPTAANAQLFGGLDNNTLLSGAIGAGIGGAIGSNLAGSGVRDEGTAIGAALGGLAGAAYGNSRSRYAGNPYAGSFNPGFNGNNLVGTGIGAGIGGVIGSNIAGSGNRQEGTAIGAALGGLAGYGISNARNNRNAGYRQFGGQNFGGQGYGAQGYGYGYNSGYAPAQPYYSAPQFSAPQLNGPQYVPSGQYVTGQYIPSVTYAAPPAPVMPAPRPRQIYYAPDITVAAPNVRLAGPPLQRPDIHRGLTRVETMPIARAQRTVIPAAPARVSSRYTISEPYTLSAPTMSASTLSASVLSQPTWHESPRYAAPAPVHHNNGHHIGNSVHITQPSTGSGHYTGEYTGKTYCYAGSDKRYTAQGAEIIPNCSRR